MFIFPSSSRPSLLQIILPLMLEPIFLWKKKKVFSTPGETTKKNARCFAKAVVVESWKFTVFWIETLIAFQHPGSETS